jgi:hypothetical protein
MPRNRGGLARAQREHGFRHPVDHAQKGAGRALRHELPRSQSRTTGLTLALFVMLFQDVVFG